jgi:hypothetical protein
MHAPRPPRAVIALLLLPLACSSGDGAPAPVQPAQTPPAGAAVIEHRARHPAPSAAYRWVDIMLEVTGREVDQVGARPTIISRQMAIPMTAMYDAWAAYDERAVGTRLGGSLRRPAAERTAANKEKAIAHAVHRTLVDLFPADRAWLGQQMLAMGHDPDDRSTDPATPAGIGNTAAAAVLAYRRHDGANQWGEAAGPGGQPYADTTAYEPVNPPDRIIDPDRWQPIPFTSQDGGSFVPGYLTPHWHHVIPFALDRADQFRPGPPPLVGSERLEVEVEECIAYNAGLTLAQKALVEFMRDGPRSTGQSGHWLQFAQDVSRRDRYDLDRDVKLFFTIANTAFDAFITAWDAKRAYDSSRPWTLVRHLRAGHEVSGWLGACEGVGPVPADRWHPYSPPSFVTPPFPGYVSGHSTVSAACAKMLELFTGSDRLGAIARHRAGMFTEEGCAPADMLAKDGVAAEGAAASAEVTIDLPTFSATAELAGISRVMGGYHIQADNLEGLALGRSVAQHTWSRYQAYFEGTASPPRDAERVPSTVQR